MYGLSGAPGPNSFIAGGGIASNSDPNQFRDTPPVNTVAYVGGGISTMDIGTQINDAYNSLPAGGGDIYLLPKQGGGCYQFSTPIVMMTSGKYARLHTVGPGAAINNTVVGGTCLQYTRTTRSVALTMDWSPAGGGHYVSGSGIDGLVLINSATNGDSSPCSTTGGCGSAATGIQIAGSNTGAMLADIRNLTVEGFGIGVNMPGNSGTGWGVNFYNPSIAYNTVGLQANGTEGTQIFGGSISVNGIGVKLTNTRGGGANGNNIRFYGTHLNANTVLGVDGSVAGTCLSVDFFGAHFENLGTLNAEYVNCAGGVGQVNIYGGEALDDNSTGSAAPYWFAGNLMNVSGLSLYAAPGRPAPTSLFVVTTAGHVDVINQSAAVLAGNLGLSGIPHSINGNTIAPEVASPHFQVTQAAPPVAMWGVGGGRGATCSVVAGSDSAGLITCTTGSQGTTAASGTMQLQFNKPFTGTAAACHYMAAGNWPAGTTFQDKTPANTADMFEWNTNGAALPGTTALKINYFCPGR